MSLTEKDITAIAEHVAARLKASNPGFVTRAFCNERHKWNTMLLYGLYALITTILVAVLAK